MRALLSIVLLAATGCAQGEKVRPAAVAGMFYPGDAAQLTKVVDGLLATAPAPDPNVVALVAPHAGYEYSGAVAAQAYGLVKGRKFARVVVIAPSHVDGFGFTSIYNGDAYVTPLGRVPVDKAFAAKLASSGGGQLSSRGHVVPGGRGEHALEDQLPFLQRALGEFQLVAVVMGDQDYESCRALGTALAKLARGSETLIVASSDLSHFHKYDDAARMDRKTLNAIREWDYLSLSRNVQNQVWEACGGAPIVATMIAAERMGAQQARILKYANSGDVTGDKRSVVGYGAVAIIKAASDAAAEPAFSLSAGERGELLALAKRSVESAVRKGKLLEIEGALPESLALERGAFVTLKKKGELRGCIGYVAPMKPLGETVRDVAAYAAMKDPRFPAVTPAELAELQFEISVLSPLRRVLDVKQIEVGKHGLVMRQGGHEGLLLPQVPVEQHWDRQTFLQQTCLKAGLPANAWQEAGTDIFAFTALVFGEGSH